MANHHILATLEYANYHILATKSRRHKSHLQHIALQSENLTREKLRKLRQLVRFMPIVYHILREGEGIGIYAYLA